MKSIGRWEEERRSVGEEEGRSRREEVEGKEEMRRGLRRGAWVEERKRE